MRRTMIFLLASAAFLFLANCNKETDGNAQSNHSLPALALQSEDPIITKIKQDAIIANNQFFSELYRVRCETSTGSFEVLEKWTRNDSVDIKYKSGLTLNCRPFSGKFKNIHTENAFGIRAGVNNLNICYRLQYKKFDEGLRLMAGYLYRDCNSDNVLYMF